MVAGEAQVPAYVVFTDATLTAIAEKRPSGRSELAMISGVGERKIERYGDDVLAILGGADPAGSTRRAAAGSPQIAGTHPARAPSGLP